MVLYLLVRDGILVAFLEKSINLCSKLFIVILGISGTGGSSNSLLAAPSSLIYDATNKQLYVVDTGNARVMAYCEGNSEGTMIAGTGTTGVSSTKLSEPYAIGFDTTFNLYVMDSGNQRLQKYFRI